MQAPALIVLAFGNGCQTPGERDRHRVRAPFTAPRVPISLHTETVAWSHPEILRMPGKATTSPIKGRVAADDAIARSTIATACNHSLKWTIA